MNPIKYLITAFSPVNPLDVASNELVTARLELLRAETGVEYSVSLVDFNKKRVKRLETYLGKVTPGAVNG